MIIRLDHRDVTISAMSREEHETEAADGLFYARPGIIRISRDVSPAEQARLALHELAHAVWDSRAMAARVDEETAVDGLSAGLAAVFRNNPEFLGVLHQALTNGVAIV